MMMLLDSLSAARIVRTSRLMRADHVLTWQRDGGCAAVRAAERVLDFELHRPVEVDVAHRPAYLKMSTRPMPIGT